MNYEQFKKSLMILSMELHTKKKQNLLKYISEQKNIMNYMELKECQRQEEVKNHNKFTEKITGGIANRSLEQKQYVYLSRHKKLNEEIIKYEFDYEKESKKSEIEILNNFYKYIGIDSNSKYKNNMKKTTKINRFHKFLKKYKIDIQGNDIQSIKGKLIKNKNIKNIQNNLFSSKKTVNKISTNELKYDFSNSKDKKILRASSSSKNNIIKQKQKIFVNSNRINWSQMRNIYFDYNPIYGNKIFENNNKNIKSDTDSEEEILKKLNESRNENKLFKNYSALNLKGNSRNNILPIIKTSNPHQNDSNISNLRYYH